MKDQNDPQIGSIPVKENQLDRNELEPNMEAEKDLGEAGQEQKDPVRESAEKEAAKKEMVEVNSELVMKIINQAKEFGFFGDRNVDNFSMNNQEFTVFKLSSELSQVNEKLRSHSISEDQDEELQFENQRAKLTVELLYAVTALIRSEIPQFNARLLAKVNEAKRTGDKSEVIEDINGIKGLTPQWEALVTNSRQVLPFLRENHSEYVSDRDLGELNESLYSSIDLDPNDLSAEEDNVGTGVLSKEMDEVTRLLKMLEETEIPEDEQGSAGQSRKDGSHSPGGEITGSGTSSSETVIEAPAGLGVEVPTGEVTANVPESGVVSERGKGGSIPSKGIEPGEEDEIMDEAEPDGEQEEENRDEQQQENEEVQEDQQQEAQNEQDSEEQSDQPENEESSQEEKGEELTEEERRKRDQA